MSKEKKTPNEKYRDKVPNHGLDGGSWLFIIAFVLFVLFIMASSHE